MDFEKNSPKINLGNFYVIDLKLLLKLAIGFAISGFLIQFFSPIDGDLDLLLIQPWLTTSGEFYLKNDWFLAQLNHRYVKNILISVYLIWGFIYLKSFLLKQNTLIRWQYGYALVLVMISTASIGLLKSQAAHACPWDMVVSNGHSFYWNFSLVNGHCFPGGHASTGFALIVGYFIYRDHQVKRAYFYLCSALILGFAMGFAQIMRGAHFFSHNLWTLWVISFINIFSYVMVYKPYSQKYYNKGN